MPQNRNPYADVAKTTGQTNVPSPGYPTYTEAWALIEAARRMATAIEFGYDGTLRSRNKVREAIQLNWRLWTVFQSNLTVGEHEVPDDIRTNILTLARFIDKHTVETLREPTPEKISTLIEINRNIGGGLLDSINASISEKEEVMTVSEATMPSAAEYRATDISG